MKEKFAKFSIEMYKLVTRRCAVENSKEKSYPLFFLESKYLFFHQENLLICYTKLVPAQVWSGPGVSTELKPCHSTISTCY